MLKKTSAQEKKLITKHITTNSSTPEDLLNGNKPFILRDLSTKAINLYVKKADIKNFTKLALSNPEDLSHEKRVEELLNNHEIEDLTCNKSVAELVNDEKFLKDLGLIE